MAEFVARVFCHRQLNDRLIGWMRDRVPRFASGVFMNHGPERLLSSSQPPESNKLILPPVGDIFALAGQFDSVRLDRIAQMCLNFGKAGKMRLHFDKMGTGTASKLKKLGIF